MAFNFNQSTRGQLSSIAKAQDDAAAEEEPSTSYDWLEDVQENQRARVLDSIGVNMDPHGTRLAVAQNATED